MEIEVVTQWVKQVYMLKLEIFIYLNLQVYMHSPLSLSVTIENWFSCDPLCPMMAICWRGGGVYQVCPLQFNINFIWLSYANLFFSELCQKSLEDDPVSLYHKYRVNYYRSRSVITILSVTCRFRIVRKK